MGSGQSSADKSEKFTIDANGKITRVSRLKAESGEEPASGSSNGSSNQTPSSETTPSSSVTLESQVDPSLDRAASGLQSQLSALNTMPQPSGPSDQLRLKELDDILNRMKAKYKPNSADMAGKSKSVFEEIERNLLHCYKMNKDQALKCASLSEEYKRYVEKQRAQALVGSTKA